MIMTNVHEVLRIETNDQVISPEDREPFVTRRMVFYTAEGPIFHINVFIARGSALEHEIHEALKA